MHIVFENISGVKGKQEKNEIVKNALLYSG